MNAHSPSENDLPAESCSIVPACTSSIDQLDHSQIVSQGIQKSIQEANTASTSNICTSLMSGPESGNNAMILDQMNSRKRLGIENDYSEIMERKTTKYFRYAIFNLALSKKINRIYFVGIAEMNGYQKLIYIKKRYIPSDVVNENNVLFEYLLNEADPQHSTYRCHLCYKYYDKFNFPSRYKNALAYIERCQDR